MELIEERKLANGLNIKITDHSRLIAADRWYVKIVCSVVMPLTEQHFSGCLDAEPELLASIRQQMGDELTMDLVQERNFVDEAVKEDVSQELLARIAENMTGYLAADSFPTRFFDMRYQETKKSCLVDLARVGDSSTNDDDEPADFAACFTD